MGKKGRRVKAEVKTYRGLMDDVLQTKSLWRKAMPKDGSCLFRAVSEQSWGGELELVVLSRLYRRSIVVFNQVDPGKIHEQIFPGGVDEDKNHTSIDKLCNPILLAYLDGNHYDGVYSVCHKEALELCQGILYTTLMEKVFGDVIPNTCKRKLTSLHQTDVTKMDSFKGKSAGNFKGEVEMKSLWNLHRHYSIDEIIAMSWTMYFNSPVLLYRQMKETIEAIDRNVAANIQFRVGDKCFFSIGGQRSTGEIVRLHSKPDQHLVRVSDSKDDNWEIPAKDLMLMSAANNRGRGKQQQRAKEQGGGVPFTATPTGPKTVEKSLPHGTHPPAHTQSNEAKSLPEGQCTVGDSPAPRGVVPSGARSVGRSQVSGEQSSVSQVGPGPAQTRTPRTQHKSKNKESSPGAETSPVHPSSTATPTHSVPGSAGKVSSSGSRAKPSHQSVPGQTSSERPAEAHDQGQARKRIIPGGGKLLSVALEPVRQQGKPSALVKSSGGLASSSSSATSRQKPPVTDTVPMAQYSSVVKKNSGGPSGSLTSEDAESSEESSEIEEANEGPPPMSLYTGAGSTDTDLTKTMAALTGSQRNYQQPKQDFVPQKAKGKSSQGESANSALLPNAVNVAGNGRDVIPPAQQLPLTVASQQLRQDKDYTPPVSLSIVSHNQEPPFPIYKTLNNGRESPYLERKMQIDELSQKESWPMIPDVPICQHLSKGEPAMPPYRSPSNSRPSMIYAAVMSSQPPTVSSTSPITSATPSNDLMYSTSHQQAPSSTPHHLVSASTPHHLPSSSTLHHQASSSTPHHLPSSSNPHYQSTKPSTVEHRYFDVATQQQQEQRNHTSNMVQQVSNRGGAESARPLPQFSTSGMSPAPSVLVSPNSRTEPNIYRPLGYDNLPSGSHTSSDMKSDLAGSPRMMAQSHFSPNIPSGTTMPALTSPDFTPVLPPAVRSHDNHMITSLAPSAVSPQYSSGSGLPYTATKTPSGSSVPAPHHHHHQLQQQQPLGYSPYNASQFPNSPTVRMTGVHPDATACNLSVAAGSGSVTMGRYAGAPMSTTTQTRLMEGVYEARSVEAPSFVSSHSSAFSAPLERHVSHNISGASTSTGGAPVIAASFPAPSSAVLTKESSKNRKVRPEVVSAAVQVTPPPPPPPPKMVNELVQTDFTGMPTMEDKETATTGVYVSQEELAPPQVPLDSMASKIRFCLKYSLQCLHLQGNSSDLMAELEQDKLDDKLEQFFLFQRHLEQQQRQFEQQQLEQQRQLEQQQLEQQHMQQQQLAFLQNDLPGVLQDQHIATGNQPRPLPSSPDDEETPNTRPADVNAEIGKEFVEGEISTDKNELPGQEHFDLPGMGGAEVPLPMFPAGMPLMMQRPPLPHPMMPPSGYMFPPNSPYMYPMLGPPHPMGMPMPYLMPSLFPPLGPHMLSSPLLDIPPVGDGPPQQDRSLPSSPQFPLSVPTDVPSSVSQPVPPQEDEAVMSVSSRQERQSEMVASTDLPIPPSAIPHPSSPLLDQVLPKQEPVVKAHLLQCDNHEPVVLAAAGDQEEIKARASHGNVLPVTPPFESSSMPSVKNKPTKIIAQTTTPVHDQGANVAGRITSSRPQRSADRVSPPRTVPGHVTASQARLGHVTAKSGHVTTATQAKSGRVTTSQARPTTASQSSPGRVTDSQAKPSHVTASKHSKRKVDKRVTPGLPCRPAATPSGPSTTLPGTREVPEEGLKPKTSYEARVNKVTKQQRPNKGKYHSDASGTGDGSRESRTPTSSNSKSGQQQDSLRQFMMDVRDAGSNNTSLFTTGNTILFNALQSPTGSSDTILDSSYDGHAGNTASSDSPSDRHALNSVYGSTTLEDTFSERYSRHVEGSAGSDCDCSNTEMNDWPDFGEVELRYVQSESAIGPIRSSASGEIHRRTKWMRPVKQRDYGQNLSSANGHVTHRH